MKKKIAKKKHNKLKNPKLHKVLQDFIALALLPDNEIVKEFLKLKEALLKEYEKEKDIIKNLNLFIEYYESTWINIYKPETFSVYNKSNRTNNSIEAYHRVLNSYLQSALSASAFLSKKKLFF